MSRWGHILICVFLFSARVPIIFPFPFGNEQVTSCHILLPIDLNWVDTLRFLVQLPTVGKTDYLREDK